MLCRTIFCYTVRCEGQFVITIAAEPTSSKWAVMRDAQHSPSSPDSVEWVIIVTLGTRHLIRDAIGAGFERATRSDQNRKA